MWLNAIRLNDTTTLTLGCDDDTALLESEDRDGGKSWKWVEILSKPIGLYIFLVI